MFLPIMIIPRWKKTTKQIIKAWSLLEQSGLIKPHPEKDDIIIRLIGNVYIDGEFNFYKCQDNICERDDYMKELYMLQLERIGKINQLPTRKTHTKGGTEIQRWI